MTGYGLRQHRIVSKVWTSISWRPLFYTDASTTQERMVYDKYSKTCTLFTRGFAIIDYVRDRLGHPS